MIFRDPMHGITLPHVERLPTPIPTDRLRGLIDRADTTMAKLVVALIAIHGLGRRETRHLHLTDLDLSRGRLTVRRDLRHTVYLDELTHTLAGDWLRDRHRRWPLTANPHLLVSQQTAADARLPPVSTMLINDIFRPLGLSPSSAGRRCPARRGRPLAAHPGQARLPAPVPITRGLPRRQHRPAQPRPARDGSRRDPARWLLPRLLLVTHARPSPAGHDEPGLDGPGGHGGVSREAPALRPDRGRSGRGCPHRLRRGALGRPPPPHSVTGVHPEARLRGGPEAGMGSPGAPTQDKAMREYRQRCQNGPFCTPPPRRTRHPQAAHTRQGDLVAR